MFLPELILLLDEPFNNLIVAGDHNVIVVSINRSSCPVKKSVDEKLRVDDGKLVVHE